MIALHVFVVEQQQKKGVRDRRNPLVRPELAGVPRVAELRRGARPSAHELHVHRARHMQDGVLEERRRLLRQVRRHAHRSGRARRSALVLLRHHEHRVHGVHREVAIRSRVLLRRSVDPNGGVRADQPTQADRHHHGPVRRSASPTSHDRRRQRRIVDCQRHRSAAAAQVEGLLGGAHRSALHVHHLVGELRGPGHQAALLQAPVRLLQASLAGRALQDEHWRQLVEDRSHVRLRHAPLAQQKLRQRLRRALHVGRNRSLFRRFSRQQLAVHSNAAAQRIRY